jgi:hypothetical protein
MNLLLVWLQQQQQQQQESSNDNDDNTTIHQPSSHLLWQTIHQQWYDWLLGVACSRDIFAVVLPSSPPEDHGATETTTTRTVSLLPTTTTTQIDAICESAIQFVLVLQQFHFNHHHWTMTTTLATKNVSSIRDVWYQLSHEWFDHHGKGVGNQQIHASRSNPSPGKKALLPVVNDHSMSTIRIVNVQGFKNYLLYCEGLIGYIVPSRSKLNMDAGCQMIHTLLGCALLYSPTVPPLVEIIRRIVYDLIMLLLDPVAVVTIGSSSSSHSSSSSNFDRDKVVKSIAKETLHGIPELFVQASLQQQKSDIGGRRKNSDDSENDDPRRWLMIPYAIRTFVPLTIVSNSTRWDHSVLYEFRAALAIRAIEQLVFRYNNNINGTCSIGGSDGTINHSTTTTPGRTESFETTIEQWLTTSPTSNVNGEDTTLTNTEMKLLKMPWMKLLHASSSSRSGWWALGTAYYTLQQLWHSYRTKPCHTDDKNTPSQTATLLSSSSQKRRSQRFVLDMNDTAKVLATIECVIELYQTGILLLQFGNDNVSQSAPCTSNTKRPQHGSTQSPSQPPPTGTSPSVMDIATGNNTLADVNNDIVSTTGKIRPNTTPAVMINQNTEYGPWKHIHYVYTFMESFDDVCMSLSTSVLARKSTHPHYGRADMLMKHVHVDTIKVQERLLFLLNKYRVQRSMVRTETKCHDHNNLSTHKDEEEENDDEDENEIDSEDDWDDMEWKRKLVTTPTKKTQTKIVSFFAPTTAHSSSNKKKSKMQEGDKE